MTHPRSKSRFLLRRGIGRVDGVTGKEALELIHGSCGVGGQGVGEEGGDEGQKRPDAPALVICLSVWVSEDGLQQMELQFP